MEPAGQLPTVGSAAGHATGLPAEFGGQPPMNPIATTASTLSFLRFGSLILRTAAFVLSIISFSVMASIKGFDKLDQSRYLVATGIISTVYTLFQNIRHTYYLSTRISLFHHSTSNLVDFIGDQIIAYLLLSAASSVAPTIYLLRAIENSQGLNKKTSNMTSASTGMAFLAFFPLAFSAMISGYKLSTKTYV